MPATLLVRFCVFAGLGLLSTVLAPSPALAQDLTSRPTPHTATLAFGSISGTAGMTPRLSYFNASDEPLHVRFVILCTDDGDTMADAEFVLAPHTGKSVDGTTADRFTDWTAFLVIGARSTQPHSGPAEWAKFPSSYQIRSPLGEVVVQAVEHDVSNASWLYLGPHSFNPGETAHVSYFNTESEPVMVTLAVFDMNAPGKPLATETKTVDSWHGMFLDAKFPGIDVIPGPVAGLQGDQQRSQEIFAVAWTRSLKPGKQPLTEFHSAVSMQILDFNGTPKLFIPPNYAEVK